MRRLAAVTLAVALLGAAGVLALTRSGSDRSPTGGIVREWDVPPDPRAVVIVAHGGLWHGGDDPSRVRRMRGYARGFRERAHAATYNVDYGEGRRSLPDIRRAFDLARRRFPHLPIGVAGASAGGNLALLLAAERPVAFAIAEAGPTDLARSPKWVADGARSWFGTRGLRRWSPLYRTPGMRAPALLVNARNDGGVPPAQAEAFVRRYRRGTAIVLDPGAAAFVHSPVDRAQLAAARRREHALVARAAQR